MIAFEVTILMLLGAIATLAFTRNSKQPVEVVLLLGSLLVSFLPLPRVHLDPHVVFSIFLPPILFAAAYFTSWNEFLRNLRPIMLLAIGLVVTTTLGVAAGLRMLMPGIPWPQAFLLGAILAPPDASAAVALVKQFRLPRRLITVIEGESLINDATALTCYRFALGALAAESFSFAEAVPRFLYVAGAGGLVGAALGMLALRLFRALKHSHAEVLTTILTPFFCYAVAEHLGVSGVISTVVAGIIFGIYLPAASTSESRIEAKTTWDIYLFAINGLVFTLIGLQLPIVVAALSFGRLFALSFVSVALFILLVVIRVVWVWTAAYIPRRLSRALAARDPMPSWQVLLVLAWTGMRGIVSLAGALAIPISLNGGTTVAFRDELVFLAYATTLFTLLVPTFTLPWLLERLEIPFVDERQRDESLARLQMSEAVIRSLEQRIKESPTSADVERNYLSAYRNFATALRPNLEQTPYSTLNFERADVRKFVLELLEIERRELARLRREGRIHDEVFHSLAEEIDLEEVRLLNSLRANIMMTSVITPNGHPVTSPPLEGLLAS